MAHRCYIGRGHSPSEAHPVHAACFHVSLALSPLGVSCVCMCGPRVRRICLHLCAFVCILVHFNAFCAFSRIHKSGSSAVVNWNTNLCRIMRINASWSECIRMQLICMHWNARKCITFRMHPYGNAHECIKGRMHRNATHVHALKCVYMHHVQNAYIR